MGVTLGTVAANVIGGPIVDAYGWQATFYILGLPGIAVAVVLVMTVKEPPRGYSDPPTKTAYKRATWAETFSAMFSKPSYWWMLAATTIAAFGGYAIANFQSLYLQRTFKVTVGDAALYITGPAYILGAAGTLLTGWLAERIGKRSISSIAWLPGIGLLLCVPFYIIGFTAKDPILGIAPVVICTLFIGLGHFVKYGYLAAQYTITAATSPPRMRATATAILIFAQNMLGYGLGPLFAGGLSDAVFSETINKSQYVREAGPGIGQERVLNRHMCDAALQVVASNNKKPAATKLSMDDALAKMTPQMDVARYSFCDKTNMDATTFSMIVISAIYGLGGICFFICMIYLKRDFEAAKRHDFGSGKTGFGLGGTFAGLGVIGMWATWAYLKPNSVTDVIFRTGGKPFTLLDLIYWGSYALSIGLMVLGGALLWGRFKNGPGGNSEAAQT
jgi:MFS family permease